MKRKSLCFKELLVLFACMALLLSALSAGAETITVTPILGGQISGTEKRITTNLADQFDPAISINLVVYTDIRGADADVWYYDLTQGKEFQVTNALGDQELPDVSDGIIAFTDYTPADVLLYSTTTGTTTNLTGLSNSNSLRNAIGQGLVAWEDDRDGNWEIHAKNLTTGEERRISNSPADDLGPAVCGGLIVWMQCVEGVQCDIYSYDWATGNTRQITNTPDGVEIFPDVSGQRIVYYGMRGGEWDIYYYDLSTGIEYRLVLPGVQGIPHISGDFVSFDDASMGQYHVKLWHIPSNTVYEVTTSSSGQQYLNDIDGNRIVYTDDRNGNLDIYMYEFVPPPSDTTPPTISFEGTCPSTVKLNSSATIAVLVTDDDSGVASQSKPNGPNLLDTASVGTKTFTVTAQDNAGNQASNSCTYRVIYDFTGAGGFQSPINNPPVLNTAKAGSAIPVKWQLPDGHGGFISDLGVVTSITFQKINCANVSSTLTDPVETTATGNTGLRYDFTANKYIYNWQTSKSWAGSCYVFNLLLNDGSKYSANFQLK